MSFGIVLSDGETCRAGVQHFKHSHTFDPKKKITKVEMIINQYEIWIIRINFYSGTQTLIKVGMDDEYIKFNGNRVETFDIADDE